MYCFSWNAWRSSHSFLSDLPPSSVRDWWKENNSMIKILESRTKGRRNLPSLLLYLAQALQHDQIVLNQNKNSLNNYMYSFREIDRGYFPAGDNFLFISKIHGWEHKISKSRQTQATGGKNCEKAGKLPRLCGDIIQ